MDSVFAAIEATSLAAYLRASRWGYAAVNTAHIMGFSLLVGAIVPLNLRLLGVWPQVPIASLARILVPVAAVGLMLAMAAGALLFSVRADEYASLTVFKVKLALIGVGILSALELHRLHGMSLAGAGQTRLAVHAMISMSCWVGAIVCGRLIAFVIE